MIKKAASIQSDLLAPLSVVNSPTRSSMSLAAHLDKPTKFVGALHLTVSLDHLGFRLHAALRTPVLGRLGRDEIERLHAVRARIQAEADIAAHVRAEALRACRKERTHRAGDMHGKRGSQSCPVVERRHSSPKLPSRPA